MDYIEFLFECLWKDEDSDMTTMFATHSSGVPAYDVETEAEMLEKTYRKKWPNHIARVFGNLFIMEFEDEWKNLIEFYRTNHPGNLV